MGRSTEMTSPNRNEAFTGVGSIPRWVMNLAGTGATLDDKFQTVRKSTGGPPVGGTARKMLGQLRDLANCDARANPKSRWSSAYAHVTHRARSAFAHGRDRFRGCAP